MLNARETGRCPSGLENIYEILLPSVNMNAVIPLSSLRDYDYTAQHNIIEGHKFTQTLKYGLYEGVNSVKKHNYNMAKMMLL